MLIADFVPASGLFGLHRISLVRASGETFKHRFFDALGGTRDACLLGVLFCRRPVLPGPAPPPRRAPRPDPPVVCPGFGFDRLDCSCFRRYVQDSFLDSLEGEREGKLRAGSTQRRPVLLCPAPPRCPAVRRSDPTGPWCVRVLEFTDSFDRFLRRFLHWSAARKKERFSSR